MTFRVYYYKPDASVMMKIVSRVCRAPSKIDGDDYYEVGVVTADDLDQLFDLMNNSTFTFNMNCRSMSVGDLAIDESTGKTFYCAGNGWKETSF